MAFDKKVTGKTASQKYKLTAPYKAKKKIKIKKKLGYNISEAKTIPQ